MKSLSAKVTVLQSFQHMSTTLFRIREHDTRRSDYVQHNRGDDVSHTTHYL